jgi:hypothetical protein
MKKKIAGLLLVIFLMLGATMVVVADEYDAYDDDDELGVVIFQGINSVSADGLEIHGAPTLARASACTPINITVDNMDALVAMIFNANSGMIMLDEYVEALFLSSRELRDALHDAMDAHSEYLRRYEDIEPYVSSFYEYFESYESVSPRIPSIGPGQMGVNINNVTISAGGHHLGGIFLPDNRFTSFYINRTAGSGLTVGTAEFGGTNRPINVVASFYSANPSRGSFIIVGYRSRRVFIGSDHNASIIVNGIFIVDLR